MDLRIDKIEIENYKSVYKCSFDFEDKKNNAYIFVGKNGSGKSKLLEALTVIKNINNQNYNISCTRKYRSKNEPIVIKYTSFVNKLRSAYIGEIEKLIIVPSNFWRNCKIDSVSNVYSLNKDYTGYNSEIIYEKNIQYEKYCYKSRTADEINDENPQIYEIIVKNDDIDYKIYKDLDEIFINNIFNKIFSLKINANFWAANDNNILKESVDLAQFKANPDSCIPMKNIFYYAGYNTKTLITNIINESLRDEVGLQCLEKELSNKANEYIKQIWKDKDFNANLNFTIRSDAQNQYKIKTTISNQNDTNCIYSIDDISDGFKQFISIILGINIKENCNNIIAIDEPEVHLHPSAAMYLKEKILELGDNNYVFFSTHSPFMLDANVPQRHYKILKIDNLTNVERLQENKNINDDDLTEELFGINTLRDFYAPNRMLVEGQSEKNIINRALHIINPNTSIVITNGKGDNIVATAAYINIKKVNNIIALLDSDSAGILNKQNIISIGGIYSNKNVFCLNDIVSTLSTNATIEDLLDENYVSKQFNQFISEKGYKNTKFIPASGAILQQIYRFCSINGIILTDKDKEVFKTRVAENFSVTKNGLKTKNQNLQILIDFIIKFFEKVNKI